MVTKVGKACYSGCKLIDSVADAGRVVYNVATVRKTAALGTHTTLTGLKSVGRIARIFVALDAAFIPIDLAVMMKSTYDVNKYRTGQGSNSAVANEIGKLIPDLEEHEQKMKQILEGLESFFVELFSYLLILKLFYIIFYNPSTKIYIYAHICSVSLTQGSFFHTACVVHFHNFVYLF